MLKLAEHEPMPRWYELSLKNGVTQGDSPALIIKVHRLALKELESIPWSTAPVVPHFTQKFTFSTFTAPNEGTCGFQDVFVHGESSDPDWIVWEVKLPKIKSRYEELETPNRTIIAIRATMQIFFNCLWLFKGDTGCLQKQLIVIGCICLPSKEHHSCNGSLSAILTPEAITWLSKQPDKEHLQPIIQAMREAHEFMWEGVSRNDRFGALCRQPKYINFDVPGNACDLSPDYYDSDLTCGYTLVPHNVDSGLQQLTFLAGLARLHELMRESP